MANFWCNFRGFHMWEEEGHCGKLYCPNSTWKVGNYRVCKRKGCGAVEKLVEEYLKDQYGKPIKTHIWKEVCSLAKRG